MQTKTHKGFTLIEIIIALAILSVLSSVGVISYNGYMESSRDKVAEENYRNIINTMNSEFLKCRIDDNATIYESHNCSASSSPGINDLKNYFTNNLNMKNPYNQSLPSQYF